MFPVWIYHHYFSSWIAAFSTVTCTQWVIKYLEKASCSHLRNGMTMRPLLAGNLETNKASFFFGQMRVYSGSVIIRREFHLVHSCKLFFHYRMQWEGQKRQGHKSALLRSSLWHRHFMFSQHRHLKRLVFPLIGGYYICGSDHTFWWFLLFWLC